jgi:ParB family transcriptional regulator, chromosome partitioning protein
MTTRNLQLHQVIVPPHVHRFEISEDSIKDLAASIQEVGLINPITVIDNGDETYTLRAGHCRILAHEYLRRSHIQANVITGSLRDTEAVTFAENLHRTPLSPMEEAYAIQHEHTENLVSIDQIARVLHRSVEWVHQRLALVEMPPDLRDLVHRRQLPIGSALALATVTDAPHRHYLQRYAIDAGANIQVVAEWVRQWQLAAELGNAHQAPKPQMPEPGQTLVVTMPCFACGAPHPYQDLRIIRMCTPCLTATTATPQEPAHSPAPPPQPN